MRRWIFVGPHVKKIHADDLEETSGVTWTFICINNPSVQIHSSCTSQLREVSHVNLSTDVVLDSWCVGYIQAHQEILQRLGPLRHMCSDWIIDQTVHVLLTTDRDMHEHDCLFIRYVGRKKSPKKVSKNPSKKPSKKTSQRTSKKPSPVEDWIFPDSSEEDSS
jgi:hypothetical protein